MNCPELNGISECLPRNLLQGASILYENERESFRFVRIFWVRGQELHLLSAAKLFGDITSPQMLKEAIIRRLTFFHDSSQVINIGDNRFFI